ncbi:MAG TPA: hypothetical protein VGC13_18760 [Longimicrobium sp.]|jgi:hypothetical protein|uniref:hypothetical protein n=1 Tax=Longimicrobium sp. TaxID=2029185 RepID=UPI002ED9AB0D
MSNPAQSKGTDSQILAADGRRSWQAPRVDDLPRLTELTLQTANGEIIDGTCQVGSTCF